MDDQHDGVKDDFMSIRAGYFEQLIALATDKERARILVGKIHAFDEVIARIKTEHRPVKYGVNGYGAHKRAIDAMLAYLDEIGHAVTEKELADAVTGRGFRAPNPGARSIVLKSIASYLHGEAGRKRKVIREHNGLIGRGEWPDKKFQ